MHTFPPHDYISLFSIIIPAYHGRCNIQLFQQADQATLARSRVANKNRIY